MIIVPDLYLTLEPQARYEQQLAADFRVEPGLHAFPASFGQGAADRQVFQIDRQYPHYLDVKNAVRQSRGNEVYLEHNLAPEAQAVLCGYIVNRLCHEHPRYFTADSTDQGIRLENHLLGTVLSFRAVDDGLRLDGQPDRERSYVSGLDALAMQLQEDLAVVSRRHDAHWISAIHLSFPNNWAAKDKIGRPFNAVHAPVPGFERIADIESRLVDAMIERGPYIRFAWGLSPDDRLDHSPQSTASRNEFDPRRPQLFLRLERQCIVGFEQQDCALFTIRTYCYDVADLEADVLKRLYSAMGSMSPQTLRYKGLEADQGAILGFVESLRKKAGTKEN